MGDTMAAIREQGRKAELDREALVATERAKELFFEHDRARSKAQTSLLLRKTKKQSGLTKLHRYVPIPVPVTFVERQKQKVY